MAQQSQDARVSGSLGFCLPCHPMVMVAMVVLDFTCGFMGGRMGERVAPGPLPQKDPQHICVWSFLLTTELQGLEKERSSLS